MFKKCIFLVCILLGGASWGVQANMNVSDEKDRKEVVYRNKDIESIFPDWLSNQLLHDHIPFNVNLAGSDYLFNNLIYADTLSCEMDVVTRFTLTKSGKIKDCVVMNLPDTAFADEIERIVSISGKWKSRRNGSKKVGSEQSFTVPLALRGNVVVLDKVPGWGEPDKRMNGKRYNLTRYIHQVAMHIYNKCDNRVEKFDYPDFVKFPIFGTFEFSFSIDKDGNFSDLKYIDNLSGIQLEPFLKGQMFPGRLFSHEVKWEPAILHGEPVSVQVKAVIDYGKKEFSWDCFLVGEKQ